MKKTALILVYSLLAIVFFGTSAAAQITVDKVILNFKPGERPVQNVVVRNTGKTPMGIEVIPDVMVDPGTANEKRVPTKDLIVSPKRFSIKAEGQRTIRVLLKKRLGEMEQVYRVKLAPKPQGFEHDPSAPSGKKSTEVRIITTVGLLVFGEPIKASPNLTWERSGNQITFKNSGNINIYLDKGQQCIAEGSDCEALPAKRMYPGNTWQVAAKKGKKVFFRKKLKEEFENILIE